MKLSYCVYLIVLFLIVLLLIDAFSQNSIMFFTAGQQNGVADLDHFWISPTKDKNNICFEQRMEHPSDHTVGDEAGRFNAIDDFVWDQFGCENHDPWSATSGSVSYNNIPCTGKQYIKILYSKHSSSNVKIDILVNNVKQKDFTPENQGSWESFTETGWIELDFPSEISISGYARMPNRTGINNVTLSFSNNGGLTNTDASGFYSQVVNQGWSGTATPSKNGYTFSPPDRGYSNITYHQTGENYTGTEPTSLGGGYLHAFQNFDDDVDRIKRYSNFFGGDYGILNGDIFNPQINLNFSIDSTRTGHGRSLQINYGPLTFWSGYVESFERKWYDQKTSFNLIDLFPDFQSTDFSDRHIDSLAFYCKLVAEEPLTLQLELHDALDLKSEVIVEINSTGSSWQRISVGLNQFKGSFNPSKAKYLAIIFANWVGGAPVNSGEEGTLYLDDMHLIEAGYEKPVLSSYTDLLNYTNQVNFRHIWTAVASNSFFALDRHTFVDLVSVDAIGFQLSSYVIAHKNGWVNQALIEERVIKILNELLYVCKHAQTEEEAKSDPLGYASVKGIWAHFLDTTTLSRKDTKTEYSLFTNALFLSGVLVTQSYFMENDRIFEMADSLIKMADWNFLYRPEDKLMYYHWTPEEGYSEYYTDWFSEELDLAFLLGVSSPNKQHRLPANPYYSIGYNKPFSKEYGYIYSAPGANFTYWFLQMYARYNESSERFINARNASLRDKEYCNSHFDFDDRIFGVTACEGPDSAGVDMNGKNISNYHAYGYPPKHDSNNTPNGTFAVYGTACPILFIPNETIECLRYYYSELDTTFLNQYGYSFWSPIFGFPDAFHLAPDDSDDPFINSLNFRGPFYSVPRFCVDIGPMIMNIDSYLSEIEGKKSVRDYFSIHPYLADSLPSFSDFPDYPTSVQSNEQEIYSFQLNNNYPNPFNPGTRISFSISETNWVKLTIYNLVGESVRILLSDNLAPGNHSIIWDGTNNERRLVNSGLYFYKLETDNRAICKKMLLIK